ncbi:MAG: DUF2769 domain-containing protein [Candidatus Aenigmatarchaeota archaeon]
MGFKKADSKNVLAPARAKRLCLCKDCPSYVDCGERAFCLKGAKKSRCIEEEVGCLCHGCQVRLRLGLREWYFCMKER